MSSKRTMRHSEDDSLGDNSARFFLRERRKSSSMCSCCKQYGHNVLTCGLKFPCKQKKLTGMCIRETGNYDKRRIATIISSQLAPMKDEIIAINDQLSKIHECIDSLVNENQAIRDTLSETQSQLSQERATRHILVSHISSLRDRIDALSPDDACVERMLMDLS